jgi:hypothetical protein
MKIAKQTIEIYNTSFHGIFISSKKVRNDLNLKYIILKFVPEKFIIGCVTMNA